MKTRIQANAITLAMAIIIFALTTACGTHEEYAPSYVEIEPAEAPDCEQAHNNDTDYTPNGNEKYVADVSYTTIPDNTIFATPIQLAVYVNETLFSVPAFYVQGQHYFYLRDIAYILKDTIARFQLSLHGPYTPSWWLDLDGERRYNTFSPVIWDAPYSPTGAELQPIATDAEVATPIEFCFNSQNWLVGGAFGTTVSMNAYNIGNRLYVDLWQIGPAVGFETYFNAQTITFHINTHEPFVSEYGRHVAKAFLRPFLEKGAYYHQCDYSTLTFCSPSDFAQHAVEARHVELADGQQKLKVLYNVVYLVWGYRLYDFDGSGIPAIVLTWGRDISRWNAQTLYIYQQGSFVAVSEIGLHIFYRSAQPHDEMFMYSGDLAHYSGMFGGFYSVTLDDSGLNFQDLFVEVWTWCDESNSSEYIYHTCGVLAEMDEDTLGEFFLRAPILNNPHRLYEPLFPIRPFTFNMLQHRIPTSVEHIGRSADEPFRVGNFEIVVSADFTVVSCCGHYTANATLFPVTVTNIGTYNKYLSALNIYGLGCLSGYPVPINHVYFEIPDPDSCIFMVDTSTQLLELALGLAPGMNIHFYLPIYASVCATLAWYRSFEFVENIEGSGIVRHHYFDIRVVE